MALSVETDQIVVESDAILAYQHRIVGLVAGDPDEDAMDVLMELEEFFERLYQKGTRVGRS